MEYRNVQVLDHPLIRHKLTLLRNRNTTHKDFRELAEELAGLMTYEVCRNMHTRECRIETPLEPYCGQELENEGHHRSHSSCRSCHGTGHAGYDSACKRSVTSVSFATRAHWNRSSTIANCRTIRMNQMYSSLIPCLQRGGSASLAISLVRAPAQHLLLLHHRGAGRDSGPRS